MIFFGGEFLSDLYHPRAPESAAVFQLSLRGWLLAHLQPVLLSSAGGRPCTTPDAWLYRDPFNGIFGSPSAWLHAGSAPAQAR